MRRHRRTRLLVCLLCAIPFVSLLFTLTNPKTAIRDLGYFTRPIWDAPIFHDRPWKIITHYYHPLIPYSQLCALHDWQPRLLSEGLPRVVDAVIFSVELDLFEIRLRELWDVVDVFVVIEANKTFTGQPKELVFAQNKDRFAWAMDKIVYEANTELLDMPEEEKNKIGSFWIENDMRYKLMKIITSNRVGIRPGDLLFSGDVDEIPHSHTLALLKACKGYSNVIHLGFNNYLYSFEFHVDGIHWRPNVQVFGEETTHYRGRLGDELLADAGWHCSFCFPKIDDFAFKMTSYSHHDRVTSPRQLDPKVIQDKICRGADIFDMLPEAYTFKELISKMGDIPKSRTGVGLPRWVIENNLQYKWLLPGGCMRKS